MLDKMFNNKSLDKIEQEKIIKIHCSVVLIFHITIKNPYTNFHILLSMNRNTFLVVIKSVCKILILFFFNNKYM